MKRQKEFLEVHGNSVKSGKINGLNQMITVPDVNAHTPAQITFQESKKRCTILIFIKVILTFNSVLMLVNLCVVVLESFRESFAQ